MKKHVLAIDQGTTGSTALLVNAQGDVVAKANHEFKQLFPKPLWAEHRLEDIWQSVQKSITDVVTQTQIQANDIQAIGITNQRETVGCWDKNSGNPIGHAIVWQCRRTASLCNNLQAHAADIYKKTGLVLDAYFSASKINWLITHHQLQNRPDICFGTIDTFLLYKMTAGLSFSTEPSNASRTMLMDIHRLAWDDELLKLFDIPRYMLPEIQPSSSLFGKTKGLTCLPDGIPITGILGDQQAALFGQGCFEKGQTKCTYGTGAFLLSNTGSHVATSQHRLLSTVAWQINNQVTYALEGSVFMAGACIQWLRDGLNIIDNASDVEDLAAQCETSAGVMLIPAFAGLGAPYWSQDTKAAIIGLTRGTTKAHIARATLEAIALQVSDLVHCFEQDMGTKLTQLNVDGGASQNKLLMHIQSNLLNIPLSQPKYLESTGLGAALIAGLTIGMWESLHDIQECICTQSTFKPNVIKINRNMLKKNWKKVLKKHTSQ